MLTQKKSTWWKIKIQKFKKHKSLTVIILLLITMNLTRQILWWLRFNFSEGFNKRDIFNNTPIVYIQTLTMSDQACTRFCKTAIINNMSIFVNFRQLGALDIQHRGSCPRTPNFTGFRLTFMLLFGLWFSWTAKLNQSKNISLLQLHMQLL